MSKAFMFLLVSAIFLFPFSANCESPECADNLKLVRVGDKIDDVFEILGEPDKELHEVDAATQVIITHWHYNCAGLEFILIFKLGKLIQYTTTCAENLKSIRNGVSMDKVLEYCGEPHKIDKGGTIKNKDNPNSGPVEITVWHYYCSALEFTLIFHEGILADTLCMDSHFPNQH